MDKDLKKVVVLLAHPNMENSQANKALFDAIKDIEDVAVFNLSDIQILRNDATVQAVYSEGNTTCWVAAYQPVQLTVSTDLILNVQTPGIYMIRKNEFGRYIINYADPTQQRNVAELELNHKKVRLSLPEGKEKGKTTSIVG